MAEYQVTFLEVPQEGRRVKFLNGGSQGITSPVASVQSNQQYPGWYWVTTQSGSMYIGQTQGLETTTVVQSVRSEQTNYGNQQHIPQHNSTIAHPLHDVPEWAVIAALLLFTPVGVYLMWKYTRWLSKVKWAITATWLVCVWLWLLSLNV